MRKRAQRTKLYNIWEKKVKEKEISERKCWGNAQEKEKLEKGKHFGRDWKKYVKITNKRLKKWNIIKNQRCKNNIECFHTIFIKCGKNIIFVCNIHIILNFQIWTISVVQVNMQEQ